MRVSTYKTEAASKRDPLKRRTLDFLGESLAKAIRLGRLDSIAAKMDRSPTYFGDALAVWDKPVHFRSEERFDRAFRVAAETIEDADRAWRMHTLAWAGEQALRVAGDFVELGVYRGFSARMVCSFLDFGKLSERRYFLYDTFTGFDPRISGGGDFLRGTSWMSHAQSHYSNPDNLGHVVARFAREPNVVIVKGAVPESLAHAPESVAFLHVDLNSPKAEAAAYDFFWERLVSGAIIVIDDYGWANMAQQQGVAKEFFKRKGLPILELPTGQGLVVKSS